MVIFLLLLLSIVSVSFLMLTIDLFVYRFTNNQYDSNLLSLILTWIILFLSIIYFIIKLFKKQHELYNLFS